MKSVPIFKVFFIEDLEAVDLLNAMSFQDGLNRYLKGVYKGNDTPANALKLAKLYFEYHPAFGKMIDSYMVPADTKVTKSVLSLMLMSPLVAHIEHRNPYVKQAVNDIMWERRSIEHQHENIGVIDLQHRLIDLDLDEYCEGL